MKTTEPRPIHLKDYAPSDYLIDEIYLDIVLDPTATRVTSRLRIRPNPARKPGRKAPPLRLDGEEIELQKVLLSGKKLAGSAYRVTKSDFTLRAPPQRPFTLELTTLCNPDANKTLSGLYLSNGIYCTQCEAEGFRRITYMLDRPDILSVYTTRIEAERSRAPVLLSNGNLQEKGRLKDSGRHFAVWHDPHPKPAYLFALVGGKLDRASSTFKTRSGRKVDLNIYVEPGNTDRCAWAMQSLKRSMRWDETRFGLEYDLDIFNIVAVSDFNMGAMENKGLNIFNDKLILAKPDTATDNDYLAIESVIAHEYFHNWTGNRITCRDWFQLCLKEGLTVFRDQEFSSDFRDRAVQRIQDVRMLKTHQYPEDAGPLAHPVRPSSYIEINNFYTATVYEKGAELCRMILTLVGRQGFRKGMDLYFERHDGEAATVEDFIGAMADANAIDLSQFMHWYAQAGTPNLVCDFAYDARRKQATLRIDQIMPRKTGQTSVPLHIPVKIGLLGTDGREQSLELDSGELIDDGLLQIRERKNEFTFVNLKTKPILSFLRGFSAPVNITLDRNSKDLEFLMIHDTDPFNRWDAVQTLAMDSLVNLAEARRNNQRRQPATGKSLCEGLSHILKDKSLAPSFKTECLRLPSESDIARQIGANVDPEAIHWARRQLLRTLRQNLERQFVQIYRSNTVPGRYTPSVEAVGKRGLRNAVLAILASDDKPETAKLLHKHYTEARNMTDRIIAVSLLADSTSDIRKQVLADFYERYEDDHLVMDKWFAVQAMSSRPQVVDEVKGLMSHPKFSLKNPNKVRALIGAFAQGNPLNFNRVDGQGYQLLAQTVLEIDGFNPQIAARLAGAFRSFRILEAKRKRLARAALNTIAKDKGLSRNSYEIISKILEA